MMDDHYPASSQPDSDVRSKSLPGPPFLREYPEFQVIAWQPQGVLDDGTLDQITEWLIDVERDHPHFKRFVDLSRLTAIAVRTSHIFEIARRRAEEFPGPHPVRTALFCDEWIGFGIARFYESLMENTLIRVKAFRNRQEAAEWLEVPSSILALQDEPEP